MTDSKFIKWADKSDWEVIVFFEMSRNFGVGGSEILNRLKKLEEGFESDEGIDYFLLKLTRDERMNLSKLIKDIQNNNVNNIKIAKLENGSRDFMATRDQLRITYTLSTQKSNSDFMVDIIARRK